MKKDNIYSSNPAYWAERQQSTEIFLMETLNVIISTLPKSEMPKLKKILNDYLDRQAKSMEYYNERS
jgi:hypothetical protein